MNIVCDHCLLFGYADQQRKIDRGTVGQAIDIWKKESAPSVMVEGFPRGVLRGLARWGFGVIIVASIGWGAFHFVPPENLADIMNRLEGHLSALATSARDSLYKILSSIGILLV